MDKMNIKDIDLEQLSEKLVNNEEITDSEIEIINKIFFSCITNSTPKADVIIVLGGSACTGSLRELASLFSAGQSG